MQMVPNYWQDSQNQRLAHREQECAAGFNRKEKKRPIRDKGPIPMAQPAEDLIVRNLIEALGRLHEDLDRMELWAAALGSFQHPVPDYQPREQNLLQPSKWPSPKRL
jgi:hypothetical protein